MPTPSDDAPDWPSQATEAIVGFVDNVKYKTTRPAALASRGLVYGLVILALGIPALIMFVVGLVHLLDKAIPQEVWLVYLILGSIFTLAGLFLWRKRTA
ncbi:MAG: hypothetical protein ACR2P0_02450 [Acidimicrobiales bacterium]